MRQRLYRILIELTNGPMTSGVLQRFAKSKLSRILIQPYAHFYQINLDENCEDISSFENLHAFFTRKLKVNVRPIHEETDTVISPVDGVLEDAGIIGACSEITVKMKKYSITEMLGGDDHAKKFIGGTYLVLYLSPAHYHRIHSPVDAKRINTYSLGKKSYPVNHIGLTYGKEPLSKNFRTITTLKSKGNTVTMVMVGAMFINSVVILNENQQWKKGEEVAYFSFGSTVVLLFEKENFRLEKKTIPVNVKMGEKLGSWIK